MRFHIDWGKGFHKIVPFLINTPPSRNTKSAKCKTGTVTLRPIASQSLRLELLLQEDGIANDSPMITAVYEGYLCMEEMLTASAELRGDDAEDAIG